MAKYFFQQLCRFNCKNNNNKNRKLLNHTFSTLFFGNKSNLFNNGVHFSSSVTTNNSYSNNFFDISSENESQIFKVENIPDDSNIHVAECVNKTKVGKDLYQLTFLTGKHHKKNNNFSFIPGQWIDMFIPSRKTVGGFSITSTTGQLPYFDLAVQNTNHPPTSWLCNECKVGDVVSVQSGGSFCWDKSFEKNKILLVAGGIGINPLFSMLSEVITVLDGEEYSVLDPPKISLLYTVKSLDCALFLKEITEFASWYPNSVQVTLKLTDENVDNNKIMENNIDIVVKNENLTVLENRLNHFDFKNAINFLNVNDDDESINSNSCSSTLNAEDNEHIVCYLCGPPSFVDDYEKIVQEEFVVMDTRVERWW